MAGTLNKGSLVKNPKSSGGGGASFPTIVTDSGSSLPSASGYQLNDTFLNTSDKKIYKAGYFGYELLNSSLRDNAILNYTTGVLSNVGYVASGSKYNYITKSSDSIEWSGNKTIDLHFKLTGTLSSGYSFWLFSSGRYGYNIGIALKTDGVYFAKWNSYQSSFSMVSNTKILDFNWQEGEYYVRLDKVAGNTTISLSNIGYDTDNIIKETVEIADFYGSYQGSGSVYITLGAPSDSRMPDMYNGIVPIDIYLLDTTQNYLKESTSLFWDTGTSLTDKTEYADKTNGALYLYENSELVKIGSSAPTILTDQTSTSMALAGNTIYKWTSALTSLSFASAEVSDLETVLYFTTGGTITWQDNSNLKWGGDGSAPSLEANTIYCISIRNGLAEIDTFGTTA